MLTVTGDDRFAVSNFLGNVLNMKIYKGGRIQMDFIWLALGIAVAGYCIGDGLKNFKNPAAKTMMDYLEDDDDHELIKEKNVHYFLGISKEDTRAFIEKYPDLPSVELNGTLYFPKIKLREWVKNL